MHVLLRGLYCISKFWQKTPGRLLLWITQSFDTNQKNNTQWILLWLSEALFILPWLIRVGRCNMFTLLVLPSCRPAHFCRSRNPFLRHPLCRMKSRNFSSCRPWKVLFIQCHLHARWIMSPTVVHFHSSKYHLTLQVVLPEASRVLVREGAPWHECPCDLGQNCHSTCNREGRLCRLSALG